jgi:hypothetical protein
MVLFVIGMITAGCEISPRPQNIFENPVCDPPCWKNITPGVTTKADALAILSKINEIDQPITDPNQPLMGFDDAIDFTLYKDINRLVFMYILNDRVSMITFTYKLDITLKKAIELFGTPQSVFIGQSGEFDEITFIDPDKGIDFGYRFHLDKSSRVSPTNEIDWVTFFEQNQYIFFLSSGFFGYSNITPNDAAKNMLPWKGYGSIEQYMITIKP